MKKNKLKILEQRFEIALDNKLSRFESAVSSLPINIIGKAFYGKRKASKKDGSFTSTLWYVFCYLPIVPIESFRLTNFSQTRRSYFPRIFALDEYIDYDSKKIDFDWVQMVSTLIQIWTLAAAIFVLFLTYPLYMIILSAAGVVALLIAEWAGAHKPKDKQYFTMSQVQQPAVPVRQIRVLPVIFPKTSSKEKPVKVVKQVSESHVPNLWDDLFQTGFTVEKPRTTQRPRDSRDSLGNFLEALGYINFIFFPAYFFLYVYLREVVSDSAQLSFFSKIYSVMSTGNLFAILSLIVGIAVYLRNRMLGFILIILAICIYFSLHAVLWTYLNTF